MYRLITLIAGLLLGATTAFAQLERVDMIEPYEDCDIAVRPAVIDPAGAYAYFGMEGTCRKIAKIDLSTFELVDTFQLESNEILSLSAAVIDSEGQYAYVTTQGRPVGVPGTIIKIDLETFERVDTITLDSIPGENTFRSGVIDPDDHFAYFGNNYPDGKVLKLDLVTFEVVGLLSLETLPYPSVALIDHDGHFAYFSSHFTDPGLVVKVDLETFEEVDTLRFEENEIWPTTGVIDPEDQFAYVGVTNVDTGTGQIVKVDLKTFGRVDAITLLEGEYDLTSAVIGPGGQFATFGMSTSPISSQVVQIGLEKFERVESIRLDVGENFVESAVIDPEGIFAYFGANAFPSPTHDRVVKVRLTEEIATEGEPSDFVFSHAVPNPADRSTSFTLHITQTQHVTVDVSDNLGRHVQTLYNGSLASGIYETFTFDVSLLPPGVYVVRATGEHFVETQRMTVLR